MKKKKYIDLVCRSLAEDIGKNGDVASKAIFSKKEKATFVLIAKDSGILCGMEPFSAVFVVQLFCWLYGIQLLNSSADGEYCVDMEGISHCN